jgi:hypothetical protein
MGRGRAKAKQTKVARELKYFSPNTETLAANHGQKGAEGRAVRSASSMISMPVVSTPRRRVCSRVSVLMARA